MANQLKAPRDAGKACVNAWLAIPSSFSAEVMAGCGWDSVTVDMQHGVQDYESMVQCFQAMDKHSITPLVRVPWNEPGIIGKALTAVQPGRHVHAQNYEMEDFAKQYVHGVDARSTEYF